MKSYHESVMLSETVDWLTHERQRGGVFVDATLGGGGHAEGLLLAHSEARVIGIDQDDEAIRHASERLARFGERFRAVHANFRELADYLKGVELAGVVMDLGVSSHQLDHPDRGFSFMRDGLLDMRMDRRGELTAADVLNCCSEKEIARILWDLGEERASRRIARRVVEFRKNRPIRRTAELADLVMGVVYRPPHRRGSHPATNTFRALRMMVNDEMGALKDGLLAAWSHLARGGRLAVISFHSMEDRLVKQQFRHWAGEDEGGRLLTRKPLEPDEEETLCNARARSAKLRVIEKCGSEKKQEILEEKENGA
ncbi:MAG: 16S rRNA (cytosine(1402)-N(4))-methyltransferase RsmH [Verrucomicrobiae bacterium]|nr:16S rRNA (cytosine(1402)-N(4))-methyltransferase RsmH [Verrucomicrobiae bacterium]